MASPIPTVSDVEDLESADFEAQAVEDIAGPVIESAEAVAREILALLEDADDADSSMFRRRVLKLLDKILVNIDRAALERTVATGMTLGYAHSRANDVKALGKPTAKRINEIVEALQGNGSASEEQRNLLSPKDFEKKFPPYKRLYRGVKSVEGGDATQRGELGQGDYGKGIYLGGFGLAQTYMQKFQGDAGGRMLRAAIKPGAVVRKIPRGIKGSAAIDEWAKREGVDVVIATGAITLVKNPDVLVFDEHQYTLDESVVLEYQERGYTLPEEEKYQRAAKALAEAHEGRRRGSKPGHAQALDDARKLAESLPVDEDYLPAVAAASKRVGKTAERLARTAALTAQAEGVREAALKEGGRVVWVVELGACLHCLAYSGLVAPADGAFPQVTYADKKLDLEALVVEHPTGEVTGPPLHPWCRCRLRVWHDDPRDPEEIPHRDNGTTFAEALQREARRAVLRGASDYDSLPSRLRAADRLLKKGASLPVSVERRAARAVQAKAFPDRKAAR